MSIPKEPRQLMINIMYLVLTAMLALNVSAEIFNAFKIVDNGLVKSNKALSESNSALPALIRDGAKKKPSLEQYAERIDPARDAAKTLSAEIEALVNDMIDGSGNINGIVDDGDWVIKDGVKTELRGKKNNDATTRILVNEGKGEELKGKLNEYRDLIISLVDEGKDREEFLREIPEIIDDETWKEKGVGKKDYTWAKFNFDRMPLQAVLPILHKFQNDVVSLESSFLGYLANKVGTTTDVVLDKFTVVSAPEKTYVIDGEEFSTDVFLSASASAESNTGISIRVNGQTLQVNSDGVATFSQRASGIGKKTYLVEGSIRNPVTDEVQSFKREYEYEVGQRSAAISASKMNVFYVGVDNPVEVSVAGVPSSQVNVSVSGDGAPTISKNSDGTFTVKATRATGNKVGAVVTVSAPGFSASKDFRVKAIPDPVPTLSNQRGGAMSSGQFKAQGGILPVLEGFDFDARCTLDGFRIVRAAPRADPEVESNPGASYSDAARRIVAKATAGDRYFFENIKCKCPGDVASRDIGTMTFLIN